MFVEEILNNKICYVCYISISWFGLKEILYNIFLKLYKNMLNRCYYWYLLFCEIFCKIGIIKYFLKNFFLSLIDLINLFMCINLGVLSNGWFYWLVKIFVFRG